LHVTHAQSVSATADRDKILLGEQINLTLTLRDVNPQTTFIANWFTVADTANHIEVLSRKPIDTADIEGTQAYVQQLVITSFDSGKWQLPPLFVVLQDKQTGKQTQLKANDIFIEVLPVDVSALKEYHPLKNVIEVSVRNSPYIIIGLIFITLVALILLIIFMRAKQKKKPVQEKSTLRGNPLQRALDQLDKLNEKPLLNKDDIKEFYTAIDFICRKYFAEQYNMHAMQLTTDELMIRLSVYLQQEKNAHTFYQLLRMADAVKFAKFIPREEDNKNAVVSAKQSLQKFDVLIMQTKFNGKGMV